MSLQYGVLSRHIVKEPVVPTMKVAPIEHKNRLDEKTQGSIKVNVCLVFVLRKLAMFLGIFPFDINKETGELSFKWFSLTTFLSLIRLLAFNFPFSVLPLLLITYFGPGEWSSGEMEEITNTTLNSTPTVYLVVASVEYMSCFFYFVLQEFAKSFT